MKTIWLPLVAVLLCPLVLAAEDYLPTPYTAEEIRDAWVEGFEVLTRTRTGEKETFSKTRVVSSTEEGFLMFEVATDETGSPLPGAEMPRYRGTWEELRDHARFSTDRATRERATWETPLGRLEGWLYSVEGEEGVTEFFFADGMPGPPVIYRQQREDAEGFVSEQLSRGVPGAE